MRRLPESATGAFQHQVLRIRGVACIATLSLNLSFAQQLPKSATPSVAQTNTQKTASLTLRIKDQTDALIPGARVSLMSQSGLRRVAEGQTDKAGELSFSKLPPGAYAVEVEFPGFSMTKQTVVLSAGVMSKVDVHGTLHAGQGDVVVEPKHGMLTHIKGLAHKIHL